MRIFVSFLWLVLAFAWGSAFAFIGYMIGGFQYISHMGLSASAGMNLLIAALCVLSACLLILNKYRKGVAVVFGVVASIHLFNAFGIYLLTITNGQAGAVLTPFFLLAQVLPTNSSFIGMPVGNFPLLLLPLSSLILLFLTLPFLGASSASPQTGDDA